MSIKNNRERFFAQLWAFFKWSGVRFVPDCRAYHRHHVSTDDYSKKGQLKLLAFYLPAFVFAVVLSTNVFISTGNLKYYSDAATQSSTR